MVHKDQAEGLGDKIVGSVKEAAGKVSGNERLEAKGVAQKTGGEVKQGVGDLKEGARDILKK